MTANEMYQRWEPGENPEQIQTALYRELCDPSFSLGVRSFPSTSRSHGHRPSLVADFARDGDVGIIRLSAVSGDWENIVKMDQNFGTLKMIRIGQEPYTVDISLGSTLSADATSALEQVLAACTWERIGDMAYEEYRERIQSLPLVNLAEDVPIHNAVTDTDKKIEHKKDSIIRKIYDLLEWMHRPYRFFQPGKTLYRYIRTDDTENYTLSQRYGVRTTVTGNVIEISTDVQRSLGLTPPIKDCEITLVYFEKKNELRFSYFEIDRYGFRHQGDILFPSISEGPNITSPSYEIDIRALNYPLFRLAEMEQYLYWMLNDVIWKIDVMDTMEWRELRS